MKVAQKYSDAHAEYKISVPYLATNNTRLEVTDDASLAAAGYFDDYDTKYNIYIDPATHTPQAVQNLRDSYNIIHPFMQGEKKMLKGNKHIELKGEDYKNLFIHENAPRRKHVPAPLISPTNAVLKETHLVVQIFTSNPNPPHEKETKMPTDVMRIGRTMAVVAAGSPEPTEDKYHPLADVGSTVYDIVFANEQVGMTAYLITNYKNYLGESGPQSKPVSFPII